MVKFLFSVHTITEAKQSNRQGIARAVDLPARSFDGAPWCSATTGRHPVSPTFLFLFEGQQPLFPSLVTLSLESASQGTSPSC